jgi:hypothetical protein
MLRKVAGAALPVKLQERRSFRQSRFERHALIA